MEPSKDKTYQYTHDPLQEASSEELCCSARHPHFPRVPQAAMGKVAVKTLPSCSNTRERPRSYWIPVRSVWNISFDLPVITLGLNQNKFIYIYNNYYDNNNNNNIIYIHQHQLPTCETNGLKDGASTSLSAPSNPKKGWDVPLPDINSSQVWRRHPWSYWGLSSSVLRCRQMKLPMDFFMFAFVCICTFVSISWR